MPSDYRRKAPPSWLRLAKDYVPHAPSHTCYIIVRDEQGNELWIDRDLDYLFKRDEHMTRRVWTEDSTVYTEVYETGYNSREQQRPRKIELSAFIWEVWHVEKLPRWIVGFEHKSGANDFRMNNLVPVVDRARMPKSKPKKKKS